MRNAPFASQVCSVARALELVGEWWTLLIIREALFGTRRFNEFGQRLGIARNVLAERLAKLVEAGLMERTPVPGRGNPQDYTLTEKGRDLLPAVLALMQWGDRWVNGAGNAPIRVVVRQSGKEIPPLAPCTAEGKRLTMDDLCIVPGPGANEAIRARFGKR